MKMIFIKNEVIKYRENDLDFRYPKTLFTSRRKEIENQTLITTST